MGRPPSLLHGLGMGSPPSLLCAVGMGSPPSQLCGMGVGSPLSPLHGMGVDSPPSLPHDVGGGEPSLPPCCVLWGWGALPPLPILGIRLRTMHETEIIPFSSLARAAAAQTLAGTNPVLGNPRGGSGMGLSPGALRDKGLACAMCSSSQGLEDSLSSSDAARLERAGGGERWG